MTEVTNIRGEFTSLETMMEKVRSEYPDAVSGIVIVFDRDGAMHSHWKCNAQELALAGARLGHLAATY